LLAAFGLPKAIFAASESALKQVVTPVQAAAVLQIPAKFEAQWALTQAWLSAVDDETLVSTRRMVSLGDPDYPAGLLQIEDPPVVLYMLGRGQFGDAAGQIQVSRSVAIVGSRNPTHQGAENAHRFAQAFAAQGLTVVSGMALGVDGAAHQGALEGSPANAGNRYATTVAVVGTGLDRVYPRQHRELAHQIAAHGLLISEYPLGTPPLSQNFPRRNRLISGLSRGTLVVEAALLSGSLITARMALEQGKDIFAIPGSIHSVQSRGCHALIKQGAKLVESAEDVLEELNILFAPKNVASNQCVTSDKGLFYVPSALLDSLGHDPVTLDALQARTGVDTASLQAQLLMLELEGQVARLPGGLFQRTASA
jgi:DNA processing protein